MNIGEHVKKQIKSHSLPLNHNNIHIDDNKAFATSLNQINGDWNKIRYAYNQQQSVNTSDNNNKNNNNSYNYGDANSDSGKFSINFKR